MPKFKSNSSCRGNKRKRSDSKKQKYYHSTKSSKFTINEMEPKGYYEKIQDDIGCPEIRSIGGISIGYPISDIEESSFSKSIAGAIIGGKDNCWKDTTCSLDIYETEETPDIDISECDGGDFIELEEVRYRRIISVKKILTVIIKKDLVNQILQLYDNGVSLEGMDIIKNHITKQIKKAKKSGQFQTSQITLSGMDEIQYDKEFAMMIGMPIEELYQHEEIMNREEAGMSYDKAVKEVISNWDEIKKKYPALLKRGI
jgi:hypothetical protein